MLHNASKAGGTGQAIAWPLFGLACTIVLGRPNDLASFAWPLLICFRRAWVGMETKHAVRYLIQRMETQNGLQSKGYQNLNFIAFCIVWIALKLRVTKAGDEIWPKQCRMVTKEWEWNFKPLLPSKTIKLCVFQEITMKSSINSIDEIYNPRN